MSRILALVDNSVYARSVGACAAWISSMTGAEVDLVHVVDHRRMTARNLAWAGGMAVGLGPGMVCEAARTADDGLGPALTRGADLLEEIMSDMLALGTISVQPRLVQARLEDVVAETQDEADLIVLGKRGESADFARLPLGSDVARLARLSTKPMVLAARAFSRPANWLLGFASNPALRAGIAQIARGTVLPRLPCQIVHAGPADGTVMAELNEAGLLLSRGGFETSHDIVEGQAEHLLPRRVITDDIGMIAMGGLRKSALQAALSGGGTAEALIRACQVPALLLR